MDLDDAGKKSNLDCFHTTTKRVLKRKHASSDEVVKNKPEQKSFLTSLGEKLGLRKVQDNGQRSIFPSIQNNVLHKGGQSSLVEIGNLTHAGFDQEYDLLPPSKKRVKFDEENLVTIKYHCQYSVVQRGPSQLPIKTENKSLFHKFLDFTGNLF